ncbi:MAG: hypothetical protein OCC45_06420 [Desulfotalea sp.]
MNIRNTILVQLVFLCLFAGTSFSKILFSGPVEIAGQCRFFKVDINLSGVVSTRPSYNVKLNADNTIRMSGMPYGSKLGYDAQVYVCKISNYITGYTCGLPGGSGPIVTPESGKSFILGLAPNTAYPTGLCEEPNPCEEKKDELVDFFVAGKLAGTSLLSKCISSCTATGEAGGYSHDDMGYETLVHGSYTGEGCEIEPPPDEPNCFDELDSCRDRCRWGVESYECEGDTGGTDFTFSDSCICKKPPSCEDAKNLCNDLCVNGVSQFACTDGQGRVGDCVCFEPHKVEKPTDKPDDKTVKEKPDDAPSATPAEKAQKDATDRVGDILQDQQGLLDWIGDNVGKTVTSLGKILKALQDGSLGLDDKIKTSGSGSLPDDNIYDATIPEDTIVEEDSISVKILAWIESGIPFKDVFSKSRVTASGSPVLSATVWGKRIESDISQYSNLFDMMGLCLLACATILSFFIVIGKGA